MHSTPPQNISDAKTIYKSSAITQLKKYVKIKCTIVSSYNLDLIDIKAIVQNVNKMPSFFFIIPFKLQIKVDFHIHQGHKKLQWILRIWFYAENYMPEQFRLYYLIII